jgi:hypothetical protein
MTAPVAPEPTTLPPMAALPIQELPCWTCASPQGDTIRWLVNQGGPDAFDQKRSPHSGLPFGCCRIRRGAIVRG